MNLLAIRKSAVPPSRFTFHVSRVPIHVSRFTFHAAAFTLIELLVVISIVGLLAGLAVPVVNNFKPNVVAGATRQLLDDVARARQLAISQRTTVYMVFVPTNFWNDGAYVGNAAWFNALPSRSTNLFDKQAIAYNFVSLHSMGDQPGRWTTNYLSSWKTLPEGAFISPQKFGNYNASSPVMVIQTNSTPPRFVPVYGFRKTFGIPFPTEDAPASRAASPYVILPYIAFDYMGRLVSGRDEIIPLARGSVDR